MMPPERAAGREKECRPLREADQELRDRIAHAIIFTEAAVRGLRDALAIVDERLDVEQKDDHD
jgi:hypothetical protein